MFIIYIDRLKDGSNFSIEERVGPEILEIENDPEIRPCGIVSFLGKAYLVDEYVIVEGSIQASCEMRCATCNEFFIVPIAIEKWQHEISIKSSRSGSICYSDAIREAILLEVPFLGRCGKELCLNRDEIQQNYFSKNRPQIKKANATKEELFLSEYEREKAENGYQPFKDL